METKGLQLTMSVRDENQTVIEYLGRDGRCGWADESGVIDTFSTPSRDEPNPPPHLL